MAKTSAKVVEFPFSSRPPDHVHDGGYVLIYRRTWLEPDSALGKNRRLVAAWHQMVGTAVWEPEGRDRQFGESWIHLNRGQLIVDYREWAKEWAVPVSTFYDACQKMVREGRLRIESRRVRAGRVTRVAVFTVVNFDLYQPVPARTRSEQDPNSESRGTPGFQGYSRTGSDANPNTDSKEDKKGRLERDSDVTESHKDRISESARTGARARATQAPRKNRSLIPSDWHPSAADRAYAVERGLDPDQLTPEFVDHHRAKGSLMLDWSAAWRTWCRNEIKFARTRAGLPPRPKPAAPPDGKSMIDRLLEIH